VEESNDRLIVVLGMHRSGTSAITRALKVLGVDVGGRLLLAADGDDGDNETGFWEDIDFNGLNIELLRVIDKDWFYTSPVTQIDLEILNKKGYFLKAETLVKEKLKDRKLFGVKDPRMAKLLPFWKEVFARSDINVNYVLAIRQPLSVVKSIENRGWGGRERIFLLWLNHVIESLSLTDNTSRVIVDYDHLMRDSEHELERMARSLNLPVDKKELDDYQSKFLDHNLQHSKYQPQDCGLDSDCPALAAEIYLKLQAVISESGCADDAGFQQQVMQWTDEFDRLGPMLTYIDRTLVEAIQAAGRQRQKESENADLRHEVAENHRKFGEVSEILSHREHEASDLREALSELAEQNGHRCREIDALTTQVTEIQSSTSWRITAPIRLVKKTCGALYLSLSSKRRNNNDFNPDWYLEQNPDVKNSGQDPLAHYLEYGQTRVRARRPLSFLSRNRARLQIIASMTAQVIEKTGGVYAALTKTGRIIQREGWVSVKKHILHSYNVYKKPGAEQDYTNWIAQYDTLTAASRSNLAKRAETFEHQPLISVVMPVYNANSIWLAEAIDSVRHQVYQNWELCIADDASTEESVRSLLERYAGQDSRIKLVFRGKNGRVSATSNSALEIAKGEWIALLDHDDLLSEHALFWIVDCINKNKHVQMIYSDEDKVDGASNRSSPYFKCDWNIDLFYSQNMFSHLGAYRTSLVNSVGGFRVGIEGAQDYDLALRCIEKITQTDIKHIPRVLYHWRTHAGSTASSLYAKPHAMIAGERALNEHFERTGIQATAQLLGNGYRTKYTLPNDLPLVSLIIPTRDNLPGLKRCIKSILNKSSYSNYEILIVDNGSVKSDAIKYFKEIQKNSRIQVIHTDRPLNFPALNNRAATEAKGDLVGLLNDDIEVISKGWMEEMVSLALQDNAGAIGARLLYPNGTIQHAGIILGLGKERVAGHSHIKISKSAFGYFGRTTLMQSLSAVTAACLVIRKDIYLEVGGFNDQELGIFFSDVDFCLRVRAAGYKNVWTPFAELYHDESSLCGSQDGSENRARFDTEVAYMQKAWGDLLLDDPAYSPNLTLEHGDFTYAWPPRRGQLG
jgi:glycosyltransferase involved in cell wall biosynthesis